MNSVIVGIFDTQAAANDARSRLLAAGFLDNGIVVSDEVSASGTDAKIGTPARAPHEEEGAISRFFHSIFGDGDHTDSYEDTYREALRRGHYGVSVTTDSPEKLDLAEKILNECGALDIDERSQQWRSEGWTGGASAVADASKRAEGDTTGTLKEIAEELKVGKRAVARGGVRVFSRVVETPVEETVRLREEHVDVQRRAVDRPATEADFAAFKEGSVEVREMSEEAVVHKDARVVGEVDIGKTVTERDETVRDTLRQTKVEVEAIKPQGPEGSTPTDTTPMGSKPAKPI